ncbi:hypothetical protein, partial [uncultured Gimesia sp.]
MKTTDKDVATEPAVQQPLSRKLLKLALILCACIATGVLIWEELLEDRVVAKRFGVVEPGKIYRSGQISSYLIEPV